MAIPELPAEPDDDAPLRLRAEPQAAAESVFQPQRKRATHLPKPPKPQVALMPAKRKRHRGTDDRPETRWWWFGLCLLPLAWLLLAGSDAPDITLDDDGDVVVSRNAAAAALPEDTMLHWPMALASGAALACFAAAVFPRGNSSLKNILGMAAAASVVGVLALFAIEILARARLIPILLFPVWLLAFVIRAGNGLMHAADGGFLAKVVGSILGTGLPEELAKLALLLYLANKAGRIDWRSMRVLGVASGIGFGSAEAVLYAGNILNGAAPWSAYAARFISCAASHGILSGVAALMVFKYADQLEGESWGGTLWRLCLLVGAAAGLHGLYNGSLMAELPLVAVLADFAGLALLAWLSRSLLERDG